MTETANIESDGLQVTEMDRSALSGPADELSEVTVQNDFADQFQTEDVSQGDDSTKNVDFAEFTVPEGVVLNPELLKEFKDLAKAYGLTQNQAQSLTDLGVKLSEKLSAGILAEHSLSNQNLLEVFNTAEGSIKSADYVQPAFIKAQSEQWLAAIKADKEIGGDKLAENLAVAARAVDALVSPQLKELFNKSGLGNHPDLVKAFFKAGTLISEDALVPGGRKPGGAASGRTLHERNASVLYGGGGV